MRAASPHHPYDAWPSDLDKDEDHVELAQKGRKYYVIAHGQSSGVYDTW